MQQKYRVKPDCEIYHDDKLYQAGDELELDPKLALQHAANLEVVGEDGEFLETPILSDEDD